LAIDLAGFFVQLAQRMIHGAWKMILCVLFRGKHLDQLRALLNQRLDLVAVDYPRHPNLIVLKA
jgi:hypothetical protein